MTESPYDWLLRIPAPRPCLSDDSGRSLTYGDTTTLAARISARLADRGVRPGDRIAVQVDKSLDAVLLYLGCLHLGAVIVPLNTAYTIAELEYFLADSDPSLIVGRPDDLESHQQLASRVGIPRVESLGRAGEGTLFANLDTVETADPTELPGDALAALLYTSGTTGRSKGAMLTRRNLVTNATALAEAWHLSDDDKLVHVLPLFHVHGLFLSLNPVFAAGGSVTVLSRFDPAATLEALRYATVFMGVPTHYTRLLALPDLTPEAVREVRLFVSGSAPLLAATHLEFSVRTGKSILERYGMTETLVNTTNPYAGVRKPGSVGLPVPGVELRITDAVGGDGGHAVGMIEIRGDGVCAGYWRSPEKTLADRTGDGYFRTGDLGYVDADGYLHISGRAKDLVITGGYNVYPKEVEMELDAMADVAESAVFGIPHPDFGEGVTAAVVLKVGAVSREEEMVHELRCRLAPYKVPKRILVVSDLPRNALGKVQKNRLRETYSSLYATDS